MLFHEFEARHLFFTSSMPSSIREFFLLPLKCCTYDNAAALLKSMAWRIMEAMVLSASKNSIRAIGFASSLDLSLSPEHRTRMIRRVIVRWILVKFSFMFPFISIPLLFPAVFAS